MCVTSRSLICLYELHSPYILCRHLRRMRIPHYTSFISQRDRRASWDFVVPLFRDICWFKAEEIILWRPKLVLLGTRFLLFCVAFVFSLMLLDDAATLNFSGRVGEKPCTIGDKPLFESPSIYIFSVFSASYPNYSVLYDFCINFCFFISLSLYF